MRLNLRLLHKKRGIKMMPRFCDRLNNRFI